MSAHVRTEVRAEVRAEARLVVEFALLALGVVVVLLVAGSALLGFVMHLAGRVPILVGAVGVLLVVVAALAVALLAADRRGAGWAARLDRRTGRGGRTLTVPAADGTPLHVETDGPEDAAVTVVFAHGWMADLTTWREQRAALGSTRIRRVFYDQRGHGRSGWRGLDHGEQGVRQLADDLAAVIAATAPAGRLVLVGHSMGGMSVIAFAGRHQDVMRDRVDGVLLCATTATPLGESMTLGLAGRPRLQALARKYAVPAVSLLGLLPPRVAQVLGVGPFRLAAALLAVGPDSLEDAHVATVGALYRSSLDVGSRCLKALMQHDERDSLSGLDPTRVTVIVPGRDRLVPLADQLGIADLAGGARVVTVPDSGHMVTLEAPEVVSAELLNLVLLGEHHPGDLLDL